MADIVDIGCVTTLPLPVEKVIKSAGVADLDDILVLGWDKDGELAVFSSNPSKAELVYLMEAAKLFLMDA